MKTLSAHKGNEANDALEITADDRTHGNANHIYTIDLVGGAPGSGGWKCELRFQRGPIKETGVNGITNEALLAIVADRLEGFQSGPYACEENAKALIHVMGALDVLHERTAARVARGVEGTHTV